MLRRNRKTNIRPRRPFVSHCFGTAGSQAVVFPVVIECRHSSWLSTAALPTLLFLRGRRPRNDCARDPTIRATFVCIRSFLTIPFDSFDSFLFSSGEEFPLAEREKKRDEIVSKQRELADDQMICERVESSASSRQEEREEKRRVLDIGCGQGFIRLGARNSFRGRGRGQ